MQRLTMTLTALFFAITIAASAQTAPSPAGKWTMSAETPHGAMDFGLTLKQDGEKLTGTFSSQAGEIPVAGEFLKGVLTFKMTQAPENYPAMSFKAKIKDDGTMSGTISSDNGDMAFTAKRAK